MHGPTHTNYCVGNGILLFYRVPRPEDWLA